MTFKAKDIFVINTAVFIAVALSHLFRVLTGATLNIGGFTIPLWMSYVGVIVSAFLAWKNWEMIQKRNSRTAAQILAILVFIDFIGVLFSWYYGIEVLGFSGFTYIWPAIFDAVVIGLLIWYSKKKK